jgi:hypothetical protein
MFGRREAAVVPAPFYQPYKKPALNHIYNLLFCDDPELFRSDGTQDALRQAVLSEPPNRRALEEIGNASHVESRFRVLAFNRLRQIRMPVPSKILLGTIIEFPQTLGLDVLASFVDGRMRYINQAEKVCFGEPPPPIELVESNQDLMRVSQIAVNHLVRFGQQLAPRRPPPTDGTVRLTFLVSDGPLVGEASYGTLVEDQFAKPIVAAGSMLLKNLVKYARAEAVDVADLPHLLAARAQQR